MTAPSDNTPLTSLLGTAATPRPVGSVAPHLYSPAWVGPNASCFELLNEFQTGSCRNRRNGLEPADQRRSATVESRVLI